MGSGYKNGTDGTVRESVPRFASYGTEDARYVALGAPRILLREPHPDAVLAQWLNTLATSARLNRNPSPLPSPTGAWPGEPIPPRRWDDAALADFAGLSSTIACECPRHIAELLVQLSHFEAYSAECAHRSPADAALASGFCDQAHMSRAFKAACGITPDSTPQLRTVFDELALLAQLHDPRSESAKPDDTKPDDLATAARQGEPNVFLEE